MLTVRVQWGSVSVKELQRAVSCKEWGKFSADMDAVSLEGVLPPRERSQLVRDAQAMYGWYSRCSSFVFVYSNQQT